MNYFALVVEHSNKENWMKRIFQLICLTIRRLWDRRLFVEVFDMDRLIFILILALDDDDDDDTDEGEPIFR